MSQRAGEVVMRLREHVQPRTITPRLQATMAPGTCLDTDAYDRYRRLEPSGDAHERGCHSRGA